MTDCPCCGYPMMHCFRHHQTVSFCRHCWQEMPDSVTLHDYSFARFGDTARLFLTETETAIAEAGYPTACCTTPRN